MSVFGDDDHSNNGNGPEQQIEQRIEYSRSDVATTRRALSDLEQQSSRLGEQIQRQMATANTATPEEFRRAWENRSQLNQVNEQISAMRDTMERMMPGTGNARLSNEERTQIQGLYASGLYTQTELANQYGVSQPTIGDVVRRGREEDNTN